MTDETTALAERFIEAAWNRADFATVDELADPEFEVYYPLMPTPIKGAADFNEFLAEFRTGMPDGHFALQHLATQGDTAVFRWDATGTHKGELLGIPPTGREVRWTGISVVQVANGKVVKEWGEEDGLTALRQLGVIPA
ncbi:ester cyclase [Pseudonocardia sp. NPDC049154]|uniref:ester cyclase n=1 Tax=Pseudonocardia sp. NPDC049154 TaxID=3155501 RepID=UPI0033DA2AB3